MTDEQIIQLYNIRSEQALVETAAKYGSYCRTIAFGILKNEEDAEECLSDTYLKAWSSIPPHQPSPLSAFLGKIARNTALNLYKRKSAQKRGGPQIPLVLEELRDGLEVTNTPEQIYEERELARVLNTFLASLQPQPRIIFMRRYWYLSSIKEIALDLGFSQSKVKMSLLRSRKQLKQILEKEGFAL